jgi:hypothetical protein
MRKISTSLIGLTTALTLTVAACGDDGTGVTSGDDLTSAEVSAVLAALSSVLESVRAGAQAAPSEVPIVVDQNFNVSVPCDAGTLGMSGSISGTDDVDTGVSDVTTAVRWDPNACVVSGGTNTLTVDGAPHIDLALAVTTTEDTSTASGTETGGFSFTTSDGRSGSCEIDVTFDIETTDSSVSATVTGTICGQSADGFETLGV